MLKLKTWVGKKSFHFKKSPLKICRKCVNLDKEICLSYINDYVSGINACLSGGKKTKARKRQ